MTATRIAFPLVPALLLSVLLLTALSPPARAAGTAPAPTTSPMEQSAQAFNNGLRYRDKAWELEERLADAQGDKEREKLRSKIERQYKSAAREFQKAIDGNPGMYQAWGSLGYALRKQGDYDASLEAYDRALELQPDYGEAIEYRGEAYLGLGRVEDAKQAYQQLLDNDRALSNDLLVAMKSWVETRSAAPDGIEPGVLEEFAVWVEERSMRARPEIGSESGW
jgi:tetratricopeptide (TPR) repeat protein